MPPSVEGLPNTIGTLLLGHSTVARPQGVGMGSARERLQIRKSEKFGGGNPERIQHLAATQARELDLESQGDYS